MALRTDVWKTNGNEEQKQIADGAIKASEGLFGRLILVGNGDKLATAVLYDNASAATGIVIARAATMQTAVVEGIVSCRNGIYLDIGGVGAAAIVHYR